MQSPEFTPTASTVEEKMLKNLISVSPPQFGFSINRTRERDLHAHCLLREGSQEKGGGKLDKVKKKLSEIML